MRFWSVAMLVGSASLGCGSGNACESPVQLLCCVGGCSGDVETAAVCGPGGWACPSGSVAPGECLGPRPFCSGSAVDGGT